MNTAKIIHHNRVVLSLYGGAEARFPRQQSLSMQIRDWEDRVQPVRGWGRDLRDAAGCVLFCVVVCTLLLGW